MLQQFHPFRVIFALAIGTTLISGCANTTAEPEGGLAPAKALPVVVVAESNPQQQILTANPELPVQQWFHEARSSVGEKLGVDLSHVGLRVTDTEGIAVHAKTSLMHALGHDLRNNLFTESLVDNILTLQTESVLAIYSPSVKQILLHDKNIGKYLDHQIAPKGALQALLVHELVHASDDLKYAAFDQNSMSYQEVFAKSAVVEGHAQWQTRNICKALGCKTAFNHLNRYMFDSSSQEDPALQYLQSRSFKNLEFVYKEGERFIDELKQRANSDEAVSLAFKKPPRDSIQIIDPDSFPDLAREKRNDLLSVAIENTAKPWDKNSTGRLKRNVLAAAAFSVDPTARQPIVNFYTSKILAATKHEYYEHASDVPIPVAVIALQTDTNATARKTASLIFDSTFETYNQLSGNLVEVNMWNRQHHTAELPEGSQAIELYTASGQMNNGLVNACLLYTSPSPRD